MVYPFPNLDIPMSFALTSPVTGAAVTGITSPTYTVAADIAPTILGKQYVVTALGGTQTDVSVHSLSSPFFVSFTRPTTFKPLSLVNPSTGRLASVPRNTWKMIVAKGATPLAGQAAVPILFRGEFVVPAGVDTADPNEIRAFVSFLAGTLSQSASGIAAAMIDGVI